MSISRLEKIRQILAAQDKKEIPGGAANSGALYRHWDLKPGTSATIRILPDGNTKNALPWVENQQINLEFPGIVGESPKVVRLKVPCVEMWGKACPILGHIRKEKWFQDDDTKALGSKYWKKYKYLMQGFIVDDGIDEEESPENPIRKFVFNKQIFSIIRAGYSDPELEFSIDDYDEGIDLMINCEQNGQWNNFSTSKFKRKSRSLNDTERAAIEQYGLTDLEEFRPKEPTDEELDLLFEMFMASLDGEFYDPKKWGHLPWRPRGLDTSSLPNTNTDVDDDDDEPVIAKPVSKAVSQKEVDSEQEDSEEVQSDPSARAAAILAKLKNKK
jgi:hypothetical protein